MVYIENQID